MSEYKAQIRAQPKANSRAAPSVEAHQRVHGVLTQEEITEKGG